MFKLRFKFLRHGYLQNLRSQPLFEGKEPVFQKITIAMVVLDVMVMWAIFAVITGSLENVMQQNAKKIPL